MPYKLDTEDYLEDIDCIYIISSHHRHNNPTSKSKWNISLEIEINIFKIAYINYKLETYICWGILINDNNRIVGIGHNRFRELLLFSKFIDGNSDNKWHGYPADYIRNIYDRPPVEVLKLWKNKGFILKHHIAKIRAGKKCNL